MTNAIDDLALQAAKDLAASQPRCDYEYDQLPLGGPTQDTDIVVIWRNGQLYQVYVSAFNGGGGGGFFPVEDLTNFVQTGGPSTVGQALVYAGGGNWKNGVPKLGLQNLDDTQNIGAAVANDVLTFDGTNWIPQAPSVGVEDVPVTWNDITGGTAVDSGNNQWIVTLSGSTVPATADQQPTLLVGDKISFSGSAAAVGGTNTFGYGIQDLATAGTLMQVYVWANSFEPAWQMGVNGSQVNWGGAAPPITNQCEIRITIYRISATVFVIIGYVNGFPFCQVLTTTMGSGATAFQVFGIGESGGGHAITYTQLNYTITTGS